MKGKFGRLDIIIICTVIAAAVFGGTLFLRKKNEIQAGHKVLIEFDVLAVNLTEQQAQSIKGMEDTDVMFGKTNIDTGLLKSVKIEPYRFLGKNILEGEYLYSEHPTHYQATLTIEKEVVETEDKFLGEKEEIRIGELTPVKGKGFGVGNCYVTDLREVAK